LAVVGHVTATVGHTTEAGARAPTESDSPM